MHLSTQEAIYEEFRNATRDHLMKNLKHDGDWGRFNEIENIAAERIAQENQEWQQSYHSRLAEARQIVLRETHGNILEPPKREGIDAIPDRKTLDAKADQRIRIDHDQRLAAIKLDELNHYQELRHVIQYRDAVKGRAKTDFEQAQTRSAPIRSGPIRSR